MDIFSSFDPAISSFHNSMFSLPFWLLNIIIILMISTSFWINNNQLTSLMSFPTDIMYSQSQRTFNLHLKTASSFITPLFIMFIIINLTGLAPYIFSSSSHLMFTLSFGLIMWLSLIVSSIIFAPQQFIANLLPSGAPFWLNPFLVIIETLSMSVRPITLSFRLAANMSAGHIVLGLIASYSMMTMFNSPISFLLLMSIQIIYTLFEIGICLIQAYIFCLLLTLYSDDHGS